MPNIQRFVLLIWIIPIFLNGCTDRQQDLYLPQETIAAPTLQPPANHTLRDIFVDQETNETLISLAQENPGGVALGVEAAYKHSYGDGLYGAFFVDAQTFRGEITYLPSSTPPETNRLICLLNHIQTPCHPSLPDSISLDEPPFVINRIPVEINGLAEPLAYDFDVIVINNAYADLDDPLADSRLWATNGANMNSIHVNGTLQPPKIEVQRDLEVLGKANQVNHLVFPTELEEMYLGETGMIPFWTEAEGIPGEELSFFLHFGTEKGRTDDVVAVAAFINYEQTPILVDGEPHLPLYVEHKANKWQRLPVSIKMPDAPGVYELVIMGRPDVFKAQYTNLDEVEKAAVSIRTILTVDYPSPTRTPFADLTLEGHTWRWQDIYFDSMPSGNPRFIPQSTVTFENGVVTIQTLPNQITTGTYQLDPDGVHLTVSPDDPALLDENSDLAMLWAIFHGPAKRRYHIEEDRLEIVFGRDEIGLAHFVADLD